MTSSSTGPIWIDSSPEKDDPPMPLAQASFSPVLLVIHFFLLSSVNLSNLKDLAKDEHRTSSSGLIPIDSPEENSPPNKAAKVQLFLPLPGSLLFAFPFTLPLCDVNNNLFCAAVT